MNSNAHRIAILDALINYSRPLEELRQELRGLEWDSPEDAIKLKPKHLINILCKYVDGHISVENIHNWAELLEFRDDIEIIDSKEIIRDIILELSNPLLFGELSIKDAKDLICKLSSIDDASR